MSNHNQETSGIIGQIVGAIDALAKRGTNLELAFDQLDVTLPAGAGEVAKQIRLNGRLSITVSVAPAPAPGPGSSAASAGVATGVSSGVSTADGAQP